MLRNCIWDGKKIPDDQRHGVIVSMPKKRELTTAATDSNLTIGAR